MKYENLTFLIPIRIESEDRLYNLTILLDYYLNNFKDLKIMILEADINSKLPEYIKKLTNYVFIEDNDPVFHRTKYLNILTMMSETKYVSIYDGDVILPKSSIDETLKELDTGIDMVIPYVGCAVNIPKENRNDLRNNNYDISFYDRHFNGNVENDNVGGSVFFNKESYIDMGLENENFYGWGLEDDERYNRALILNKKIARINNHIFHLEHIRTLNSSAVDYIIANNSKEFSKISNLDTEGLRKYVESWLWVNR